VAAVCADGRGRRVQRMRQAQRAPVFVLFGVGLADRHGTASQRASLQSVCLLAPGHVRLVGRRTLALYPPSMVRQIDGAVLGQKSAFLIVRGCSKASEAIRRDCMAVRWASRRGLRANRA